MEEYYAAVKIKQKQKNKLSNQRYRKMKVLHGTVQTKRSSRMLNITHQRNANQNLNEVPLHASQNGCYPKVYKQCKLVQPLWRTVWRFLKKLEIELPYDPAVPLLGIHTKETRSERDTCIPCSSLHCLSQPGHGSNLDAHQQTNG